MAWFFPTLIGMLLKKHDNTFSNIFGSFLNKYTGAGLTGAEQEANQFTAEQAELANERDVFNYQHRYQWEVQDMQKAGLNPALLYGGSSGAGSVPSAPAGSSVSPTAGNDPISAIMDLALLKANIENIKADTGLKQAEIGKAGAETERTKALTQYEIDDIVSNINFRESQISRNEAEIDLAYANIALLESDAKTRDAWNAANLKLAEVNAAKTEADKSRILQETENLKRDFAISFAQEAAIKANNGFIAAQTANALVRNGILKYNETTAMHEANIKAFEDDKKSADRVWNNVARGAGIARDAGIGIGAVVGSAIKGAASAAKEVTTRTIGTILGADGNPISKTIVKK